MLDIIVILIILVTTVIATKKGFIKAAYGLMASVAALIVAFFIYPAINGIMKMTPVYTYIKQWNTDRLSSLGVVTGLQAQADMIKKISGWLPSFIGNDMIKNNNTEVYKLLGVDNVADYMSTYIANLCISGLAIMVTWLVVRIIFGVVMRTLDLMAKLPVIDTMNKFAGGVLGIGTGVLIIWIICLIIPFVMTLPEFKWVAEKLPTSYLTKWLYENNLLWQYLNKFFLS